MSRSGVGRRVLSPMRLVRRPLGRIAAFGVLPSVSLISNLVVLPILSARFGQAGWSSVLLGQSIGAAAAVVCSLAWPIEGPHRVAGASGRDRPGIYALSLRQRAMAVALLAPVVVGLCLLSRPSMPLVCVLSAIAIQLNALGPGWYFVGVSHPSRSLVAEGGPRLLVNLTSIGLVAFLPLWTYPAALIAGMLGTLVVAWVLIIRDRRPSEESALPEGAPLPPHSGRVSFFAVVARGADAGNSYLGGPLIALVAPAAYPLYAAVDRLGQSLINVLGTTAQGLTAWVGEGAGRGQSRRITGAALMAVGIAVLAHVVLLLAAPFLLDFLFAGTVQIDGLVRFLVATLISGTFLTRALVRVLLVPLGLAPVAYRVMLGMAVVALPLVGVAAALSGSVAAIAVAAIAPWVSVAVQLAVGYRGLRTRPAHDGAVPVAP